MSPTRNRLLPRPEGRHDCIAGRRSTRTAIGVLLALALVGCDGDDGRNGAPGAPGAPAAGPAPNRALRSSDALPGIVARVIGVSGGSLAGGVFRAGDRLSVTFELEESSGATWDIGEMNTARALVSGPTFNYQRVLAEVTNVASAAVQNGDGTYTYTFASPIPTTYLAPLNDSPDLGPESGELTGEQLLDGTYTVGLYFGWNYTLNGVSGRDAGDTTGDFLLGPTAVLEPRELVTSENCNACHDSLRFHGGLRRATTLCLLCHTSGAEDRPSIQSPTPGASVDFKVMIHRIHNGSHLPSVNGVTTELTGARDYTATPAPYQLVGFGDQVHDYSEIVFPAWPNFEEPMPRDLGYTALAAPERAQEDQIRRGVTSCSLCHGDPDGLGPIEAPAQGHLAYTQPSRTSCTSCHDDWVFEHEYVANGETMPAEPTDASCRTCHPESGSNLAVRDGHLHPLLDSLHAQGANLELISVDEAGAGPSNGRIEVGEKLTVTFRLLDDLGGEVSPSAIQQLNATLIGPTTNMQMLESTAIPLALLSGPQPYTIPLPTRVSYELVGADAPGLQTFTTAGTPHLNVAGALTEVNVVTGFGAGFSLINKAITGPINFIDVNDPTGFARNDFIVIADGAPDAEYLRIQYVEGNRLWFGSPTGTAYPSGPKVARPQATQVREVTIATRMAGVDFSVNEATGELMELIDFGTGDAVLATYSTEFVVPAAYPVTLNGGPDLDEQVGNWTGKPLIDGTYRLTMWGRRDLNVALQGETNSYRERFEGEAIEFLVGADANLVPYEPITDRENCYACHVAITFHGRGRIGVDSCIACHGVAGAGDRPRYVAANAPETAGVNIGFKELIHKVHMGAALENAETYLVNGFSSTAYPNNFSSLSFEHIHFPAMPDGVKACATCHGAGSDAWKVPQRLDHPSAQVAPGQPWALVCGACHDGAEPAAHIAANTAPTGAESCGICHGEGQEWSVEAMHQRR